MVRTIITNAPTSAAKGAAPANTVFLAGPLDQINAWVAQWGTSLQILGGTILAICMVLVGIKLGAKSVASGGSGANTGHRESFGAIFGLVWSQIGFTALTRGGTRDFSSVTQVVATKYEVLVEHRFFERAQQLLANLH